MGRARQFGWHGRGRASVELADGVGRNNDVAHVAHCYSLLRGAEVFHQRNCANRIDWTVAAPPIIDCPGIGLNQPILESSRCVAVHASDAEGSLAEFVSA